MTERFTNSSVLRGKFTNNYEFEISQIGDDYVKKYVEPLQRIVIRGELIPNGSNTDIVICVVPYAAWVPVICSMIIGLLGFVRFTESNKVSILIMSIVLLLILPIFYIYLIANAKEKAKTEFSKTFGLNHVREFGNA